ncbi:MAG TPA: rhodanese-like domain-containing protein [Methylocystis sp.]|jgi:rhodanese-related sulfurtransferase
MNAFVKLSASALVLSLALAAPIARAADNAPAAAPTAAPAAAPAVTPVNDPAYTYKTPRLNRAAVDAVLSKPEQALILDIRRPDELTKIGGFPVYLSIQTSDVQKSLGFIPKDRLIIVVSNRAHRAGAVGDILHGLGYNVVGATGVLDYQDEGGALTKIAPPPPRQAAAAPGAAASAAAPGAQANAVAAAPSAQPATK